MLRNPHKLADTACPLYGAPPVELRGKTALLTGATGGLGHAIATALAGKGSSLILSSRKPAELEALSSELNGEHRVEVCDLADPGAALELARSAADADILVANAGLPASGELGDFTPEEIQRALRVNLEAPILLARELADVMVRRGQGHIVLVSSLSGRAPSPRASLYNATKFGLRGFGLGLREDLRAEGVGVSVVMPGFVRDAGMFADSGAGAPAGMGTATPEQVGAGILRAIERNRAEVDIAPRRQVAAARFAGRHPELAGRLSNSAAVKAASEVASGQTDKR